ncbi:glycosyltransferase [Roseobacter sp. S98]|uniref:glycosyltransferase n=1 Tax=Roseobacter algicola (ex Choi et al. 2025) (nom. illeg.) TaxID=3092138 RepID=UPI0035C74B98
MDDYMARPSFSYILLTYNQQDTVQAAVESALKQTGVVLEIVISDDHSTDETFGVIQKAVAGYDGAHRIILNRNPHNLGLAGNIDKAHQLSSGDVLIAAAGDDRSYANRSARIAAAFACGGPLLVCSYADVIGPDDLPVKGNFRKALFYNDWNRARAARSKSLYIGATGAWHRDLYDRFGPLRPGTYEDLVLGFRAALENRIEVIEEALVQYRLGTGITSSDGYYSDAAKFRARRAKGFLAQQAIMQQRIADAIVFGLSEDDEVFQILRKEQAKADLGVSYYESTWFAFSRAALRNPLLALYIVWSERMKLRKAMRGMNVPVAAGQDD